MIEKFVRKVIKEVMEEQRIGAVLIRRRDKIEKKL